MASTRKGRSREVLYINASAVASLVGRGFGDKDEAFTHLIQKSRTWGSFCTALLEDRAETRAEARAEIETARQAAVARAPSVVDLPMTRVEGAAEVQRLEKFAPVMAGLAVEAGAGAEAGGAEAGADAKLQEAIAVVQADAQKVVDELVSWQASWQTRKAQATDTDDIATAQQWADSIGVQIVSAKTVVDAVPDVVTSAFSMTRGVALEATHLDKYEAKISAAAAGSAGGITGRNDAMRYLRRDRFTIGGRWDGVRREGDITIIVEAKARRHQRKPDVPPPTYDLIQLMAYQAIWLATLGGGGGGGSSGSGTRVSGELLESFPDGEQRVTRAEYDSTEWARVEADIVTMVCDRFDALTEGRVAALVTKWGA